MKTSNKTAGNRFEQDLARKLSDIRFWVHVLQQNKAGQPADLIVAKGAYTTLIDCKVISGDGGFPLSRVEENQWHAMSRFCERTCWSCWFALKLPSEEIRFISYSAIFAFRCYGIKQIPNEKILNCTLSMDEWIEGAERWAAMEETETDEDGNQQCNTGDQPNA